METGLERSDVAVDRTSLSPRRAASAAVVAGHSQRPATGVTSNNSQRQQAARRVLSAGGKRNANLSSSSQNDIAMAVGLHRAIGLCRLHQLKFLLDFGTKLNLKNENGEGVLLTALRIADDRERRRMFNFLLKEGASCEDVDEATGRDAFLWACYLGRDEQVRQLIRFCLADINFHHRDHSGNTCLHYVVKARATELVVSIARTMQQFGISVDLPDVNGVTPYIHAKRHGFTDIQEALVIEGGASPSQFDLDELNLIIPEERLKYSPLKRNRTNQKPDTFFTNRRVPPNENRNRNGKLKNCGASAPTSTSPSTTVLQKTVPEDVSSSSNSSGMTKSGHTWNITSLPFGGNGQSNKLRSKPHERTRKSCWISPSMDKGRPHAGLKRSSKISCGSSRSTSWSYKLSSSSGRSTSSRAALSSWEDSSCKGQPDNKSEDIRITRTHSTQLIDFISSHATPTMDNAEATANIEPISSQTGTSGASVDHVQQMLQFMSMQLSPSYRPKADPKAAYKRPPRPPPRQAGRKAAGGSWGMVSLFSRLKAKSQRIKMQSKARSERRSSAASTGASSTGLPTINSGKLLGRLKEQLAT